MLFKCSLGIVSCLISAYCCSAQLQLDLTPAGGYPINLSGSNKSNYGLAAMQLQLSYLAEMSSLQPYVAASVYATEFPLHNKDDLNLRMPVVNASLGLGLSYRAYNNEFNHSSIVVGGGIGVCAVRPDNATLTLDMQETNLSYNTLMDRAWFPQTALHFRWQRHPWESLKWYFGVKVSTDVVWMRDNKTRFSTELSGETYELNFRNVILMPMVGGIVGYSF